MNECSKPRLVRGQIVSEIKLERSRELRKSMTVAERRFWQYVRNRRCGNLYFRRQQVIEGFIADFFCAANGLVVEIDGGVHGSADQQAYDKERDNLFQAMGLTVLRFTNQQILDDVETALADVQANANQR